MFVVESSTTQTPVMPAKSLGVPNKTKVWGGEIVLGDGASPPPPPPTPPHFKFMHGCCMLIGEALCLNASTVITITCCSDQWSNEIVFIVTYAWLSLE